MDVIEALDEALRYVGVEAHMALAAHRAALIEAQPVAEEVLRLAEAATEGEWTNNDGKRKPGKSLFLASTAKEEEDIYGGPSRYGPHRDYVCNFLAGKISEEQAIANAVFTARARTLAPLLAAVVAGKEVGDE